VDEPFVALFCFILAGALAGFLRWNFHPASIFAGTSGIMLVGYCLAVLSILGTAKVAVALLVLGVPIIDAFWIIVRRLAARRSPFSPDRGHIHHRLLDLGLSHRASVLVIYGLCVLLAVLSLVLSVTGQMYAFMGLAMFFGLALLLIERLSDAGSQKAAECVEVAATTPIDPAVEAVGSQDR
jgi:UDP-GlcNAc:undecaprenyl-phosphate GlcNAc-1-phosphate transferase